MSNMNLLIGSLATLLNDRSVIPAPTSGYVGSVFFTPNQEFVFRNQLPKGRIRPGETFNDDRTYGSGYKRTKHYNVHVDFMTVHGAMDTEGNKNTEIINRYLELIETAVIGSPQRLAPFLLEEITDENEPQRVEEFENNVWGGTKLLVFKERK